MRKQNKQRCKACLLPYAGTRDACPHCGYRTDDGYTQSCPDALPLCSILEDLRFGRLIDAEKDGFVYVGLEMRTNKRVRIREFYPHGYVRRDPEGRMVSAEPRYTEIIRQKMAAFCAEGRHCTVGNGTVYRCDRLLRKWLKRRSTLLPTENIALRTIIGARPYQEDAADFRVFADGMFAVLCDGMGGLNGGAVASGECLRMFMELAETVRLCDEGVLVELLRQQVLAADRYVAALQDREGNRLRPGTTFVCAVVREDRLYFVSVGDSHLYRIRGDEIQLLTEEHNYFAELLKEVQAGERSLAEAEADPKKDALTSYIGIGDIARIHAPDHPEALREGNLVLICSDGLYRTLGEEEIVRIAADSAPAAVLADALIRHVEAYRLPGQDNTTCIVYRHVQSKGKRK